MPLESIKCSHDRGAVLHSFHVATSDLLLSRQRREQGLWSHLCRKLPCRWDENAAIEVAALSKKTGVVPPRPLTFTASLLAVQAVVSVGGGKVSTAHPSDRLPGA